MAGKCQCCGVREGSRWLEGRGGQELNTGTGQLQCPCVSFLRGTNNIHWTMTLHINKSGYIIVPAVPTKASMNVYTREQETVSQVSAVGFNKRSEVMSSTKLYCSISNAQVIPNIFKFCTPKKRTLGFFRCPWTSKTPKLPDLVLEAEQVKLFLWLLQDKQVDAALLSFFVFFHLIYLEACYALLKSFLFVFLSFLSRTNKESTRYLYSTENKVKNYLLIPPTRWCWG